MDLEGREEMDQYKFSLIDMIKRMHFNRRQMTSLMNQQQNDDWSLEQLFNHLFTEHFNELAIQDTSLDLRNQRVVKADAERTRLAEISSISSMPNQEIVSKIEKLLTF